LVGQRVEEREQGADLFLAQAQRSQQRLAAGMDARFVKV
jgi:hypothetical protein